MFRKSCVHHQKDYIVYSYNKTN